MIKTFPKIALIKQKFKAPVVEDISSEIAKQLLKVQLASRIKKGDSVAITSGSRGIANIDLITKTVIDELKISELTRLLCLLWEAMVEAQQKDKRMY